MKTTPVAVLALLSSLGASAAPDLIQNGSFETPPVSNVAGGYDTYFAGQSFDGWTVGGNSIDVVGDNLSAWASWIPASGHQSVDLNGSAPGSIFQDIHTIPGQAYDLSFALAANAINALPVVQMSFYWQDQIVDTVSFQTVYNRSAPGWTYYDYLITAPTDLARLKFESAAGGTAGPAIDDVSLRVRDEERIPEPVPEGQSFVLEGLILLGLPLLVSQGAKLRRGARAGAATPLAVLRPRSGVDR